MRLLFVVNPKSGRGKAAPLAALFEADARRAGHDVDLAVIGDPKTNDWRALADAHDVAVVFGGDGTVHNLLQALTDARSALYHVPMGTENLFARHFGMDRRPATFDAALGAGEIASVDVGNANGRPFAIMCSAGPDAGVVRRLAANRTGAIRHASYVAPIMAEFFHPSLGPLNVEVDGRELVADRRGALIVANSPMYALGLNPARQADMTDGLLDVVFLPAGSSLALARWAGVAAIGSPLRCRAVVHARGREVAVRSGPIMPYQLDGDEGGVAGGEAGELRIGVRPRCLRVLAPPAPAIRGWEKKQPPARESGGPSC